MTLTDVDAAALFARLGSLEDIVGRMACPRARRGLRHSQRSLIAIILCAVISGAQGPTAIGEWVKRLPPTMLRRLRCRRTADGRYEPRPSPRSGVCCRRSISRPWSGAWGIGCTRRA